MVRQMAGVLHSLGTLSVAKFLRNTTEVMTQ